FTTRSPGSRRPAPSLATRSSRPPGRGMGRSTPASTSPRSNSRQRLRRRTNRRRPICRWAAPAPTWEGADVRGVTPFGFRIVGELTGRRRLVNAADALAGYAACDPRAEVEREAYLSMYYFGDAFHEHLQSTGSPRGYAGECCAWWLWLDLDYADDLEA